MKNLIIAFLLVIIIFMASIFFKWSHTPAYTGFPVDKERSRDLDNPLYVYIFFSEKSCKPCLDNIGPLNHLPPGFIVTGVVPDNDMEFEKRLRKSTGASFPFAKGSKFKKFIPSFIPSIVLASKSGKVFAVIPGTAGFKKFSYDYLVQFYEKCYPLLAQ